MKIQDAIYKTFGFFDIPNNHSEDLQVKSFEKVQLDPDTSFFLERTYLDEYLDIMFKIDVYKKDILKEIDIVGLEAKAIIKNIEIFVFNEDEYDCMGIFSVQYEINHSSNSLEVYNDITFKLKNFSSKVVYQKKEIELHNLIDLLLPWETNKKSEVHQYNGSRWKEYQIYNLFEDIDNSERDNLLFELGTSSKIGTIASSSINAPSEEYLDNILSGKLTCFKNYTGLSLYDSFTIVGKENLNSENKYSYTSWNDIYFRIVIYCHYIKCKLQLMSNSFSKKNSIGKHNHQEKFGKFYNKYNLKKIAFNFLPNEIYESTVKSLDIENDFQFLDDRNSRIAIATSEKQQKKQELLLLIISIMALLETPLHIEGIRNIIGIENMTIYNSVLYSLICFVFSIVLYKNYKR